MRILVRKLYYLLRIDTCYDALRLQNRKWIQNGGANKNTEQRLKKVKKAQSSENGVLNDHNYDAGHICLIKDGCEQCVPGKDKILHAKKISYDSWRHGRRIIELEILINGLQACTKCRFGPLLLSEKSVKGEMKLGLGGYFYIQCQNCLLINRIPYSKTHRTEKLCH